MKETIYNSGTCEEYLDLWEREAKRGGFTWRGKPFDYAYEAWVSPNKKVTSVNVYEKRAEGLEFQGGGVAIRNPKDKFYVESGIRLAMARALRSIHYHRNGHGRFGK